MQSEKIVREGISKILGEDILGYTQVPDTEDIEYTLDRIMDIIYQSEAVSQTMGSCKYCIVISCSVPKCIKYLMSVDSARCEDCPEWRPGVYDGRLPSETPASI